MTYCRRCSLAAMTWRSPRELDADGRIEAKVHMKRRTGELSRPKRFSLPLSAFRAMYKMPTSTRKALPCRAEASNLAGAGKLAMARCERPSGVDRHRLGQPFAHLHPLRRGGHRQRC